MENENTVEETKPEKKTDSKMSNVMATFVLLVIFLSGYMVSYLVHNPALHEARMLNYLVITNYELKLAAENVDDLAALSQYLKTASAALKDAINIIGENE